MNPIAKQPLWNKNFIRVTIGTVFSAVGGIGLNTAMGVLVFDQTQSTALSALFTALSMIPQFVLPLLIGPVIDRNNPLKVLLRNEAILAVIFFATAWITHQIGFQYLFFMVFSIAISSLGIVSDLSASSIHPQIMSKENYIQGNAILSSIYPLCNIVVVPVAMYLFDRFGIPVILAGYGVVTLLDMWVESRIDFSFEYTPQKKGATLRDLGHDLKDGFVYFKSDPAIRSVFLFFSLVMFADAANVLIYPFFNQSTVLTNNNYALLQSVRSAGYLLGGLLHYCIRIPDKKRFFMAVVVYFLFVVLDSFLLLMPFFWMCITVFVLGVAGMNSANIRVSAVAAHVPNQHRAKINAFFSVLISGTMILGQLLAGFLAERFSFHAIRIGFQMVYLVAILLFVLPPKNKVRELYNYSTSA